MPNLRVSRVYAGAAAPPGKLLLSRVWAGVKAPGANLRVARVWAGVQTATAPFLPVTVSVSPLTVVHAGRVVTLTATATPTAGDTVASYSWTPVSSHSPILSSTTARNPIIRALPELVARSYQYRVVVTTVSGAVGVATVSVSVAKAKMFTIGLDGTRHAAEIMGMGDGSGTTPPPPPPGRRLRVGRVWAGVQSTGVIVDPPSGNTTLLLGARVNLPGNSGDEASWFAAGEARWGPLQCTKDYFAGGTLPSTYVSPFPARVVVLLSFARGTNFGDVNDPAGNFARFFRSVPAGTILTFQHEPERPAMYGGDPEGYVDALNAFRANVRKYRTDLPVWMFSSGYQYRKGRPGYTGAFFSGTRAAGGTYTNQADGYSYDGYRAGTNTDPQGLLVSPMQLRDEFNRWRSLIPSGSPWGVSETGFGRCDYPPDYPETGLYAGIVNDRRTSCESTYDWLVTSGASMLLLFFSGDGPDLHNWYPSPSETAFDSMFRGLARKT